MNDQSANRTIASDITLPVEGMTCASCVGRVERALATVPGVSKAEVNLMTERATVRMTPPDREALAAAIRRAGYDVPAEAGAKGVEATDFAIEGMTCASCVARVERALKAVPGVETAEVNLMTERAHVTGTAAPEALAAAVAKTGYLARPLAREATPTDPPPTATARREAEAAVLRRDVIIAALLTIPVVVMEMGGHMSAAFHHWLGATLGNTAPISFALTTLVLIGPGRRFYAKGIPALLRGGPDMNSLVAIGTLAAWGYSTVSTFAPGWMPAGTTALYFEAAGAIVTLVLLGRWLEARAKGRSSQAIARLAGMQARTARRREADGKVREVAIAELTPGDLVEIRPGERLPVDGLVAEGESWVDESAITGEPVPVLRGPGASVTGGTVNQAGILTIRATAVGEATVLAQIIRMVEAAQAGKLPIQAMVDRVTLWFVPAVIGLSLLTFALWMAFGPDPSLGYALVNAVAVLIVACPCAMGLATPVSIMVGTGRGAELGILLRRGEALQGLAELEAIGLDKTGTLTEGRPSLTDVILAEGEERGAVLAMAAAVEARSEHPLARAVVEAAADQPLPEARGFRTTTGRGVEAEVNGRRVAVGSPAMLAEAGIALPDALGEAVTRLAGQGRTALTVAIDGRAVAVLGVSDPVKADTPAALDALRGLGLPVTMLTGDAEGTARAVGGALGIDRVEAGILPAGKANAVRSLQAASGRTGFVGDGINDAPALAQADVGIAIGTGTDVAIESADVVLVSGSLAGVATAIRLGRAVLRNIRQNLFWAFAYNVALIPVAMGALYPAFGITLSPILAAGAMAISSVVVITNALRLRGFDPRKETR